MSFPEDRQNLAKGRSTPWVKGQMPRWPKRRAVGLLAQKPRRKYPALCSTNPRYSPSCSPSMRQIRQQVLTALGLDKHSASNANWFAASDWLFAVSLTTYDRIENTPNRMPTTSAKAWRIAFQMNCVFVVSLSSGPMRSRIDWSNASCGSAASVFRLKPDRVSSRRCSNAACLLKSSAPIRARSSSIRASCRRADDICGCGPFAAVAIVIKSLSDLLTLGCLRVEVDYCTYLESTHLNIWVTPLARQIWLLQGGGCAMIGALPQRQSCQSKNTLNCMLWTTD